MNKQVEQAYWNGFATKCAEMGVDAEELVKLSRRGEGVLTAGPDSKYTVPHGRGNLHARVRPAASQDKVHELPTTARTDERVATTDASNTRPAT